MKNIYVKPLVAIVTFDSLDSTNNVVTKSRQGTTNTTVKNGSLTTVDFGSFK